ncbi:MAG: alpha/beta hydrolase [Candidatus Omnitrophica bacterium]|nr:alpha/beta hydrolase [Candidatus Omnitrophota bacterium]
MKVPHALVKGQIKTKRFLISYRVYGNGSLNLVCLNGVQQSMAMWHSFISRFAQDYKIVLFDFPGQGKSSVKSGSINASIDEQVDILREVIKASGVSDVILCSASWGGVVAMIFAAKYPQLVKRLILAGMGTRPNKRMVETIKKGCNINESERKEPSGTDEGKNFQAILCDEQRESARLL